MSGLIDQPARDRFVAGHDINMSVIAPAGVGKTRAIVERIVRLARLPDAEERLPRLLVVTYSVRAAQQMQQRARVAIRHAAAEKNPISPNVERAFQQVFFGTIHSLCVRLLDRLGHYLGLPSAVGLLQDKEEMWRRFLLRGLDAGLADDPHFRELFHFYSPEHLYGLGQNVAPGEEFATSPLPEIDVGPLLAFDLGRVKGGTKTSILRAQERVVLWRDAWARGERFRPLPGFPPSELAAEYAAVHRRVFTPLHTWLHETTRAFGRRVANAYERFRLREATMTYDDQVRLALRVLENAEAQADMAREHYSVLLDEAQDTDPLQFEVLRRVAGLGGEIGQPGTQNFSIVGDFQQAIYAPRSDLASYRNVHDEITSGPRGATSRFEVTFRCDTAVIDFVNRVFPTILNNAGGQSQFERLIARDGAGRGQVVRLAVSDLPEPEDNAKITSAELFEHEADFVAGRMAELGFAGLGARRWSEVAVLCPRKNWLLDVRHALVARGLRVQLHSSDETPRDRMPGAWLTALVWIAAHLEDSFEIAGVLREIFGVSDSDMALFTAGQGERLRLDRAAGDEDGAVARALVTLRAAMAGAHEQPLVQAISQIMETTRLRERLSSIPDVDAEDVDRELDDFLAMVTTRAADGATLTELANDLRAGLAVPTTGEKEIDEDAIQLMTSHKSKGLEWDAVIVPYLFRRIEWKQASYPRVVPIGANEAIICRDKVEYDERALDIILRRERQQAQRLYYVMFTRARRTLVLFDDEGLMSRQRKRPGEVAGEFLSLTGGENRDVFHALPMDFTLRPELVTPDIFSEPAQPIFPELLPEDVRQALARSADFPHRITPHALAYSVAEPRDAEPEAKAENENAAEPDGPGMLYGTWWHEMVEAIPWQQPRSAWEDFFALAQPGSPQPERAAREWKIFLRSELAAWLAQPGNVVQVELPFLWPGSTPNEWIEGVVDLAVYSESEKAWRVIDWKTNRVNAGGRERLVEMYRGQIEAYVRALEQMLSTKVRGFLYLTQTGELVEINDPTARTRRA